MKFNVKRQPDMYTHQWKNFCSDKLYSWDHTFCIEVPNVSSIDELYQILIPGYALCQARHFIISEAVNDEQKIATGIEPESEGKKYDEGKPIMGAVPPRAVRSVAEVLTFGAKKYGRGNWQKVENAETRYLDAALRHINDYQSGITVDEESGKPTLAHAICDLMFILEKNLEKTK